MKNYLIKKKLGVNNNLTKFYVQTTKYIYFSKTTYLNYNLAWTTLWIFQHCFTCYK